eukprot:6481316-Amphidinium_carterae.1
MALMRLPQGSNAHVRDGSGYLEKEKAFKSAHVHSQSFQVGASLLRSLPKHFAASIYFTSVQSATSTAPVKLSLPTKDTYVAQCFVKVVQDGNNTNSTEHLSRLQGNKAKSNGVPER